MPDIEESDDSDEPQDGPPAHQDPEYGTSGDNPLASLDDDD